MSLFVFLFAGVLPSGSAEPINTPCEPGVPRALVLSGGGSKGAFEAGAMYHLIVHRGCDFVDIAGVSVGGLNASYVGAAPMEPNSLANLQQATRDLVRLWRKVPGPQQFLTKRFLGPVRMAIFGIESLYDFGPARKWIADNIHPREIRESGRNVRIGTVNFYDGTYHEITPGSSNPKSPRPASPELDNLDLYRDFVLAGALIPVFGEMPRIPEKQDQDSQHWPQYADGGLRHQTPVAGYFDPCEISTFVLDGSKAGPKDCPAGFLLPAHEAVRELMIVMSSPYNPTSDRIPVPPDHHAVTDGRKILERTVMDIVLDSPYRWDVGFAIVANGALTWRAELYEKCKTTTDACEIFKKLESRFPVESWNKVGKFSLPYKIGIASPVQTLTDSYDFDHTKILEQLHLGCVAANKMMKENFRASGMETRCDDDFLPPDPQ